MTKKEAVKKMIINKKKDYPNLKIPTVERLMEIYDFEQEEKTFTLTLNCKLNTLSKIEDKFISAGATFQMV